MPYASIWRKTRRRSWLAREHRRKPYCHYCRQPTRLPKAKCEDPDCATVDHYTPLARGGLDEPFNWKLACRGCNNLKGSMMPADFFAEIDAALDTPPDGDNIQNMSEETR